MTRHRTPRDDGESRFDPRRNDLTISKDGVLIIIEGDQKEEATQMMQKPEEATGSTGSVRARVINPNAGQSAAPANGNGAAETAPSQARGPTDDGRASRRRRREEERQERREKGRQEER
jgi:hypothetical protein